MRFVDNTHASLPGIGVVQLREEQPYRARRPGVPPGRRDGVTQFDKNGFGFAESRTGVAVPGTGLRVGRHCYGKVGCLGGPILTAGSVFRFGLRRRSGPPPRGAPRRYGPALGPDTGAECGTRPPTPRRPIRGLAVCQATGPAAAPPIWPAWRSPSPRCVPWWGRSLRVRRTTAPPAPPAGTPPPPAP